MPRKPPTPTDPTPDPNDGTGGTDTGGTSGGTTGGTAGTSTGGATTTRTPVIQHIIKLCGFSEDSTMVKYIDQEEWTDLAHVTTHLIDDIKDFHTIKSDGNYEASPLKTRIVACSSVSFCTTSGDVMICQPFFMRMMWYCCLLGHSFWSIVVELDAIRTLKLLKG